MKKIALFCALLALTGCAMQRAVVANDARQQMVGMNKEQVLGCMGAPAGRAGEGATEVWTYSSGDGHTQVSTSVNAYGGPGFATANGFGVASTRYCVVNVVMNGGRVSRVNYSGPTGGLITGGEQCAFAVQNCVRS